MIAYHGTDRESAHSLTVTGFRPELAGKNGSHFGDGLYLTTTKKRAKIYGKVVVSVELHEDYIHSMWVLNNWYGEYMRRCEEEFKSGVPSNEINTYVGQYYKQTCLMEGYKGFILTPVAGSGKEIILYDNSLIRGIFI